MVFDSLTTARFALETFNVAQTVYVNILKAIRDAKITEEIRANSFIAIIPAKGHINQFISYGRKSRNSMKCPQFVFWPKWENGNWFKYDLMDFRNYVCPRRSRCWIRDIEWGSRDDHRPDRRWPDIHRDSHSIDQCRSAMHCSHYTQRCQSNDNLMWRILNNTTGHSTDQCVPTVAIFAIMVIEITFASE